MAVKSCPDITGKATVIWIGTHPSQVYTTITIGIAEIKQRISPLGDSPAIAIAINPGCGHFKMIKAPTVADDTSSVENPKGRLIRQYTDVDSRYILEDIIAKLELFVQTD